MDAFAFPDIVVRADFARQLERELALALDVLDDVRAEDFSGFSDRADMALDRIMNMRREFEEGRK